MRNGTQGISGRQSAELVVATILALATLAACGSVRLPGQQKSLQRDGGLRMTLSLSCPASQVGCDLPHLLVQTRDILQRRAVEGLGVADAVTRLGENTTIIVELPGYTNQAQASAVLGARGEVDVVDTGSDPVSTGSDISTRLCATTCTPGQYKIVFTGAQFDLNALNATVEPQSKQPVVTFAFAQPYHQQFATYTQQHIGQYLTIALDGTVIESATIQSEIDSQGEITGLKTLDDAQALVTKLKYSALPLAVTGTNSEMAIPSTHG